MARLPIEIQSGKYIIYYIMFMMYYLLDLLASQARLRIASVFRHYLVPQVIALKCFANMQ